MTTVSKRRNLRDLFKRDSSSSSCVLSRPEKRLFEGWSSSNKSVNSTLSDKSVLHRSTYHVRFAEPVIVETGATACCYGPLTDEERQAYYYTVDDLVHFEKDRALTALMFIKRREANLPWEERDYSIRGLEELLRRRKNDGKTARDQHREIILAEQRRLLGKDTEYVEDRLNEVSSNSSKLDRVRASNLAKADAIFCGYINRSRRQELLRKVMNKLAPSDNE